ncbi:MAG: hypothetical protein WA005_06175 [Candidatus Binataceae bacterium]
MGQEGSFALGEWTGQLAAGYEWEQQEIQGPSGPSSEVTRNRYDEDVQLRNEGFYLIDPRLVEASAGVNLDFFQEDDKSSIAGSGTQNGTLIGYDVSTVFLGQEPYTAAFSANRNENVTSTLFGGRTDSTNQSFGLTGKLREYSFLRDVVPYFSSSIYLRQDEADESTTQLGQTFKLDETRDSLAYEADKGFQTADLNFNYQFVSDRYTGNNTFSFSTQWANLNYNLDFGPNLNRRFDSRVSYYTSSGAFAQSFLYADERLHIDHFQNLSTTYEYLLSDISSQGQRDTSQTGIFQLEHRLYQNLTTLLTLQGFYDTLTQGQRDFYAVELTPSYSHSIPWGGTLYLNGSGRYEIDDNHLSGSQIPVVNEEHTATPSGFTLNNPFVVVSSIVVVDTRSGRVPCQLDRDYDVIAEGTLTEIVPIPTSPIIRPGDPLEVSYSYQVATQGQFSTKILLAGAGMSFSWINFDYQHQQTDQTMLSGQGGQFLYDLQQDQGRIDVHREWESVDARANALYQTYDSTSGLFTLKYTLQNYGQFLTYRTPWSMVLRLNAQEMFINYTPQRETQSRDFEATLDRFFGPGNYLSAYGRLRTITDSEFPTQQYLESGLRVHWQWGKIHAEPAFSWMVTKYGPLKTTDPHLILRIGRYL